MIKLIALLTMLIDHIGFVIFPETFIFRIIGRISMPLFAYCIARGFYYSKQHGTTQRYMLYMLAFALISQYPYYLMVGEGMNIGFTWLLSLFLLFMFTSEDLPFPTGGTMGAFTILALLTLEIKGELSIDYGFYGVITPLLFYMLISRKKESTGNYALVLLAGWAIYALVNKGSSGSMAQLLAVASAFVLTMGKKHDNEINLPKWVFYLFYPVHMIVLILIRYL